MKKQLPTWSGRKIMDQKHIPDLEYAAAIHEFGNGLPRKKAEEKAWMDYITQHHREGAAFHLRGMRAAHAAGDIDEARKHGAAYGMHMSVLGLDPMDAVPAEIASLTTKEDKDKAYRFRAHKADGLLLPDEELIGGKADGRPDSDFNHTDLAAGVKKEQAEHGGPVEVAKELVKDHLVEDPKHYQKEE